MDIWYEPGVPYGSTVRTNELPSLQGEGVTDKSVWVVKSHYPERVGFVRFKTNRVVVLIRNPFDALLSYFHMGMTNTHNRSLSAEAF